MPLDFEAVRRLLPQRFPMLMIDAVEALTPGEAITAIKNVSGSDVHFLGHFPERAIFPGVLMVEAAAQAAIILCTAGSGETAKPGMASETATVPASLPPCGGGLGWGETKAAKSTPTLSSPIEGEGKKGHNRERLCETVGTPATQATNGQANREFLLRSAESKFLQVVVPGDQLKIQVKVVKLVAQGGIVTFECTVNGGVVSKGTLSFAVKA
jgi:3-hydroxymyristoyl/3-hydroxydecanoyl-(acyl carrier protein) dehydratase